MVLAHGVSNGTQVLPEAVWTVWLTCQAQHPQYGLGWEEEFGNGGNLPTRLSHEGEHENSRSLIIANLRTGFFCVANWTPVWPETGGLEKDIHSAVQAAENSVADNDAPSITNGEPDAATPLKQLKDLYDQGLIPQGYL